MRVPLEWLHEFTRPALSTAQLADRLDLTGTVVDRIHHHGVAALDFFVVGRVLTAERHPDADRLTVCHVAVGEGDTATIVCGAPNVAAGQTVAVARPGAVMPDGTTLGAAKLRGVASEGMILAEDELAIGTDHDGIMVLDDLLPDGGDLVPGTPLADVLLLATDVLELEITPNRPDCLGIYGVAREVHAATGAELAPPPWSEDPGADTGGAAPAEITVEDPRDCPRFTARAFEDVRIGPVAPVAQGAPDGRRPAADQQRRGPHELRDARDRPPGARVRPRPRRRRPPRRAPRPGGRAAADARRRRPRARRRHGRHRRRRRPHVAGGRHGRGALRGPRRARPGCCWRRPSGTAPTSTAPRRAWACGRRRRRASRRGCRPRAASRPRPWPRACSPRSWARARWAGPPTWAGARPRSRRPRSACATPAWSGCWAWRSPASARARSSPRSSSGCRTPRTGSTSRFPTSAATTSGARPTSSRRSPGSAPSTSSPRRTRRTAPGCRAA